jgi:hypothetical protein
MGLFTVTVTKRDDKTFSKTYLLNTEKVVNFHDNDAGGTVFYYTESEDRKRKARKYETGESYATFLNHFTDESFERRRLNLKVVAKGINDETFEENVNVDANRIVYAWDNDAGTYGYVEFDNGAFDILRYKTEELISDIEHEESSSVSA